MSIYTVYTDRGHLTRGNPEGIGFTDSPRYATRFATQAEAEAAADTVRKFYAVSYADVIEDDADAIPPAGAR